MVILGLDLGISTTKAVALDGGEVMGLISVASTDPVSSASGAIGKMVQELGIRLGDIEGVAVTGVGSISLPDKILEIEAYRVDEIESIGYGGSYLSGKRRALVASIGTGTALVCLLYTSPSPRD